jgi:putative glutamine amidotransferase
MPLIGISHCRKLEDYRQSVLHVGGEVRVLEAAPDMKASIDGLDGLLLTGGGDVEPSLYGDAPHSSYSPAEAGRDRFEIELVKLARAQQIPVLAICRGIQVLNVACGGTLVQDIASQVPGALSHRLEVPPHQPMEFAHEVWIDKDSQLSRIMRERLNDDACDVNSRHHQAVRQVAPGFIVSATAPDGVVEAIEDPQARFCVGVQWHPENFFRTGEFRSLFEAFLAAASST